MRLDRRQKQQHQQIPAPNYIPLFTQSPTYYHQVAKYTCPTVMQKFVISGGFGLLGRRILRHILSAGCGRARVMVVDAAPYCVPPDGELDPFGDEAVSVVTGDLGCSSVAAAIKSFASSADCCCSGDESDESSAAATAAQPSSLLSVFHLASVMSGQGEQDFDEAIRVNVDGTESLLYTVYASRRGS